MVAVGRRPGHRRQHGDIFQKQLVQRRRGRRLRRFVQLFGGRELDLVRSESLDLRRPRSVGNPDHAERPGGDRPRHVPLRTKRRVRHAPGTGGRRRGHRSGGESRRRTNCPRSSVGPDPRQFAG